MAKVTIIKHDHACIEPGTLVRGAGGGTVLLVTKVDAATANAVSLRTGEVYVRLGIDNLERFNGAVTLSNE